MIEWQSVSSSEGNHIAATVTSVLEIPLDTTDLLFPCLQMALSDCLVAVLGQDFAPVISSAG
jgi:hypothetical protein